MSPLYVCENCGRLAQMDDFQDECRPGWTHGRLHRVKSIIVSDAMAKGAGIAMLDCDVAGIIAPARAALETLAVPVAS